MKPSLWKRMEPYVKTICAKCICILLVLFLVMIYIKSESLKESLEDYGEKRSTFHAPLAYEVLAADLREPEFAKKNKTFVELTEKGNITNTSITEDPSYNAEKLVEKMISSDENSKIERTTDIIDKCGRICKNRLRNHTYLYEFFDAERRRIHLNRKNRFLF